MFWLQLLVVLYFLIEYCAFLPQLGGGVCCHVNIRARNCDVLINGIVYALLSVWCEGDAGHVLASAAVVENCQTKRGESRFGAMSVGPWIEI